MGNKKFILAFLLIFVTSFMLFVVAQFGEDISTFYGTVTVNGTQSTNATVTMQNSTGGTKTVSVGGFGCINIANCYGGSVLCANASTITFWVWNISAGSDTCYIGQTINKNLTVSRLPTGSACSYSPACDNSGRCCLRATEYASGGGTGACQASACTVIPLIVNPANATYSAGLTLDFNVSLDDPGNCSISIDAAANATMTRINSTWFNYANTFTTVGAHQVKYSCNDSNNDWNFTATRWFSIDASNPNISISAPANNSNFTASAENITVSIEDANKNYTGVFAALYNSTGYYKLDGTKLTNAAYTDWTNLKRSGTSTSHFNATLNANNFADRSYLLYVNASDNTTNLAQNKSINITIDNTVPTVALISPTNATSTTTAAQTFQCNASDVNEVNNITFYLYDSSNSSIVKMTSTAVIGTYNQTNFSYTIPYTGTFLWNCRANDSLSNLGWASSNRTITISTTTPTPTPDTGGGGGGGGGAVTAEVSQSKYSGAVGAGDTKELTYTKEELKITSIEITAAQQIDNAGITVKESTASKAGIAIASDQGGTYKYLEITKTLITDQQISKVKISFKVEKSWYTTNNNDVATTVLRRNVNGAWQDLPTTKLSEDTTYYYFEAESTGLSYFAVVAKKVGAAVIPSEEKKAVCGDGVCEYNETCSSCIADCACGTGKECVDNICKEVVPAEKPVNKAKLILIGIGILILAIIIVALIVKPKKKKI